MEIVRENDNDAENNGNRQMEDVGESIASGSRSFPERTPHFVAKLHVELNEEILKNETAKSHLEEIVKNQSENIIELYAACERLKCGLDEWPSVQQRAMECCNEFLEDSKSIHEKQCKVNNFLEYTVNIYDEHIVDLANAQKSFESDRKLNFLRVAALQSASSQMSVHGEAIFNAFRKRIDLKKTACSKLKDYLQEANQSEIAMTKWISTFEVEFKRANDMNIELLECQQSLVTAEERKQLLEGDIMKEKAEFNKSIEDFRKQESKAVKIEGCIRQKIDVYESESKPIFESIDEIKYDLTLSTEEFAKMKKKVISQNEEQASLKSELYILSEQLSTSNEKLSFLNESVEATAKTHAEIPALESELDSFRIRAIQLNGNCEALKEEISAYEGNIREAEIEADLLKKENAVIHNRISSAEQLHDKKRTCAEDKIKAVLEQINDTESDLTTMNERLVFVCDHFDQRKKELEASWNQSVLLNDQIRLKNESIAAMVRRMTEITEEVEECKVELSILGDEKRLILDSRRVEQELISKTKMAEDLKEESAKRIDEINEESDMKQQEKVKEIEDFKLGLLMELKNKDVELANLQEGQNSQKTLLTLYENWKVDMSNQLEVYECENGLLSTFMHWALRDESIESKVTSTSKVNEFIDGSQDDIADLDFEMCAVRTSSFV